ncbi:MAG: BatD family protein [Bradymonadales bacterium]|jgi:tetratricopeptide (TPR) repeat protein
MQVEAQKQVIAYLRNSGTSAKYARRRCGVLYLVLMIVFGFCGFAAFTAQAQEQLMGMRYRVATAPEDFFITIKLSHSSAYLGQAVFVHYDVYVASQWGAPMYEALMPEFVGAQSFEVDYRILKTTTVQERGRSYNIEPLASYTLVPRQFGKLVIAHASIETPSSVDRESEWISSPSAVLDVRPLPTPMPQGFDHRNVGEFSMQAKLRSPANCKVGEGIDIDIIVDASGPSDKLAFLLDDSPEFVANFKSHGGEKIDQSMEVLPNSIQSQTTYRFHFTALNEGEYSLSAAKLVYFNPKTEMYAVLSAEPMKITVEGTAAFYEEHKRAPDATLQGYEARTMQIHKQRSSTGKYLYRYFVIAPLLFVLFVIFICWRYPSAAMKLRREKAVALKKFRMRASAATTPPQLHKAVLQFFKERYEIAENVDSERFRLSLQAYGLSPKTIVRMLEAIDELKRAAFSPHASLENELRDEVIEAVANCEQAKTARFLRLPLLLAASSILLLLIVAPRAVVGEEIVAPRAVAGEEAEFSVYQEQIAAALEAGLGSEALKSIEQLRSALESHGYHTLQAGLLYNEGLAYMLNRDFGQAIARFKHIVVLDPSDEAAIARIAECRDAIELAIYKEHPNTVFLHGESTAFLTWSGLQRLRQERVVAVLLALWSLFFVVLALAFVPSFKDWRNKLLVGSSVVFVAVVLCFVLLMMQRSSAKDRYGVITDNSELYMSPNRLGRKIDAPDFSLGLTLKVLAEQDDWLYVRRYDGVSVWCPRRSLYLLRAQD